VIATKRNLKDPATWREACAKMVEFACQDKPPVSNSMAYEWLKREWNVNAIQGTNAQRRMLADVFYAVRAGCNEIYAT